MRKIKKWEILSEDDISPSPWFPLFKHKVKLPNSRIVEDYYLSKVGDVAMIVPITTKKEIVFVRQYKHGAGEIIIELPAGRIKTGHDPIEIAKAELEEETGYHANELLHLGTIFGEPSKDTFKVYGYLTMNLSLKHLQKFDENEDIEVLLIPSNKVDNKIENGEIRASDTITFIKLAQLKEPGLFK
jgi:8-oxo-dGTP pyrophosphatase MutT (NUDIX family)